MDFSIVKSKGKKKKKLNKQTSKLQSQTGKKEEKVCEIKLYNLQRDETLSFICNKGEKRCQSREEKKKHSVVV